MNRPWMPLYIADYLRDTGHLSTIEHGAYFLLIMHYWSNDGLPDNDAQLARIARMSPREWKQARPTLAGLFQDGWQHKRIEAELAESRAKYERRASAGQRGGIAKSEGKQSASNATAMPEQSNSNAEAYAGDARGNSQPQPHLSDDKTLNGRARSTLDQIEGACRQAAGLVTDPSPGLCDLSPILGLIDAGHDFETEILPVMRSRKRAGVRSWGYFVQAVHDAKATRHAASNVIGHVRPGPLPQPEKRHPVLQAREELLEEMHAERSRS